MLANAHVRKADIVNRGYSGTSPTLTPTTIYKEILISCMGRIQH